MQNGTQNAAKKRFLSAALRQMSPKSGLQKFHHRNPAPQDDSIENADHVVLQTQRSAFAQAKRGYTTTVTPLLSRSVARPRGHRAKKLWCIPFPWKTREKGIHHRSGKRVYTMGAQTPKKKKRGFPRWWCIFFFPAHKQQTGSRGTDLFFNSQLCGPSSDQFEELNPIQVIEGLLSKPSFEYC